jgi:hypothetical protein
MRDFTSGPWSEEGSSNGLIWTLLEVLLCVGRIYDGRACEGQRGFCWRCACCNFVQYYFLWFPRHRAFFLLSVPDQREGNQRHVGHLASIVQVVVVSWWFQGIHPFRTAYFTVSRERGQFLFLPSGLLSFFFSFPFPLQAFGSAGQIADPGARGLCCVHLQQQQES